jgi:hypothetical protein
MKQEPTATQNIPDSQLEACESAFASLKGEVEALSSDIDDGYFRAELLNAIDMASHGIHRLQYFRGAQLEKDYLRGNLSTIIGNHEKIWLARNRPGGLRESVSKLYESLDSI